MPEQNSTPEPSRSEFLTVQEAAVELEVSDATIRGAILEGRLPYVLMYKRKLIPRADLEAYRERTRPGGGAKPRGRPRKKPPTT